MARAVNQTIAWIAALFLSLIVFGIGLAIVFSLKPKHGSDHGVADEHGSASSHDSHETGDRDHKSPEHPAESGAEHAKPKIEHEDPHAKDGHDEEKEITPASVKAKADEHSPEAAPHH